MIDFVVNGCKDEPKDPYHNSQLVADLARAVSDLPPAHDMEQLVSIIRKESAAACLKRLLAVPEMLPRKELGGYDYQRYLQGKAEEWHSREGVPTGFADPAYMMYVLFILDHNELALECPDVQHRDRWARILADKKL